MATQIQHDSLSKHDINYHRKHHKKMDIAASFSYWHPLSMSWVRGRIRERKYFATNGKYYKQKESKFLFWHIFSHCCLFVGISFRPTCCFISQIICLCLGCELRSASFRLIFLLCGLIRRGWQMKGAWEISKLSEFSRGKLSFTSH